MNKTFFPLLLVATLATAPACAFDSSDPFGVNGAQADKPAKAQREVNSFSTGNPMAKAMASGFGLALLGPIGAIGVPIATLMIAKGEINDLAKINSFYSGTVVRGKVEKIFPLGNSPTTAQFLADIKKSGIDASTIPAPETIRNNLVALRLDVYGPTDSERIVVARKDAGYEVGDILDAKTVAQSQADKDLRIDYNKQMPRVVNVYCKHNNPSCQNDYESSLGVLSRHQDKEFPPSQYLIDPAIIAADQAKMRKEAEESKAASNSGGFSFM